MRSSIPRIDLASLLVAITAIAFGMGSGLHADDAAGHEVAGEGSHEVESGHGEVAHDVTGHDEGGHDDAAHGAHDYNEVPLIFEPKLFFWSLALFLLFVFLAQRFAWVPLIKGLDAREGRVNQALHDAEVARVQAEKLLADHDARMAQVQEEVKEIVSATRREAEAEKARIIAEADTEASAMRDQAVADIHAARQQALDDLNSQIDQQVAAATEHVLGHAG